MRWCCGLRSRPPLQDQAHDAGAEVLGGEDLVPLLGGGTRDVAPGLLPFQENFQNFPCRETIEREPDTNEGHRASLARDVNGGMSREFFAF